MWAGVEGSGLWGRLPRTELRVTGEAMDDVEDVEDGESDGEDGGEDEDGRMVVESKSSSSKITFLLRPDSGTNQQKQRVALVRVKLEACDRK
jgi:hypothetical protein